MISRIRKSMEEKDQGFTLIELLVVMIIIGILAAIAIPVFLNQRKSAVDASIKSDLRTVATLAETVMVNTQAYPAAATLTDASTTFSGEAISISSGNTLVYSLIGTTGFCISGTNPSGNATGAAGAPIITYNSQTGGLGDTACP